MAGAGSRIMTRTGIGVPALQLKEGQIRQSTTYRGWWHDNDEQGQEMIDLQGLVAL